MPSSGALPTIYVTGHRNPDTDSIAAAVGYAELMGRLDADREYVPVRLGDLNTQTIAEVWNAEPYRAVRREHLESGGPDVCRACDLPRKDSPLWITKLA